MGLKSNLPSMSTCIAITVSGSRCKNSRGLINELCTKHRNASSSPMVSCEALLVKGARKGQACGATASAATALCKRHNKSKIVLKKPAKMVSYVGMLFANSAAEEHKVSVFGPFDNVDACKDVAMETLNGFSGEIVVVEDYKNVENCTMCWTIGEDVQVCVVKIEPKNPMRSTPAAEEEVKEEHQETPAPTPKARASCSFIITRGVNKGNACGKKATSDSFCSKHKGKIGFLTEVEQIITENSPQKSKFTPNDMPALDDAPITPAIEDFLYDLPMEEEFSTSPTMSITSDTASSSSKSNRHSIPNEDDYIITHKKTKLTIYADVNSDDCKDLDIQLDAETSLTKKGSKYILLREDRTFTARSIYEASKYIIENLESDIRLDTITFDGQSIHLNTLDN